ncbi:hypothetical protein ACFVW2_07815 [Streptomyces sp. NPDC058171]
MSAGAGSDAAGWRRLAGLLPGGRSEEVMECWAIGEQEAALDLVVSGLLDLDLPVDEGVRAELAVVAEEWGQRAALGGRIAGVRSAGPGEPDVRLIGDVDTDSPGADPTTGLIVVPWIECAACGSVLGRAHRREPWGGPSFLAVHYLLAPARGAAGRRTRVFGGDEVRNAHAALAARPCGR